MMKRMLAFLCVLALLMGMYVVPASAADASATDNKFDVGFVKGDINPWVYTNNLGVGVDLTGITYTDDLLSNSDPNNANSAKIIKVPLAGYANSTSRLSEYIRDDDGSGTVGLGDGIFFTCTTVTDVNGYALFMFTSDTVSGYDNLRTDVAARITELMAEEAEGVTVTADQVTLSGSHSHGGPDFGTMRQRATRELNAAVKEAKAAAAEAGEAFDEAAFRAAYVHNPQYVLWETYYNYVVDKMAEEAVAAWKNGKPATLSKGQVDASVATGKQLNQIRQYVTTQKVRSTGIETGVEFISGAHLNTYTSRTTGTYAYDKTPVAVADDTMYIMRFTFDDVNEKPIIQVNWRAHATMLGTVNDSGVDDDSNNKGISSDYINSFRKAMENKGYRMAFIQGAAGNIVPGSAWVPENMTDELTMATYYGGNLLAQAAEECLAEGNMQEQTGNIIRANHLEMQTESQTYSEGLVEAAKDYINNGHSGYHPKPYLHTDGNYYYINSSSHANAIYNAAVKKTAMPTLSLSTYMLGDGVAIVTSPNEMYDRYSLDVDTLVEAKAATDNDWNDLVTDAYGMPFVFGYTNGHSGYLGDFISYTYNSDFEYPSTYTNGTIDGTYGVGIGSYETNGSRYAQGTGEAVVAKYGEMLQSMSDTCEKCGAVTSRTALTQANIGSLTTLTSGHYYLDEDIVISAQRKIMGEVCLDLNGHTITTKTTRAFSCTESGTVFSLMDSSEAKTGKVISHSTAGDGGVIRAYNSDGTVIFNLYGGTLQLGDNTEATEYTVQKGGVVSLYGTMNMYGGTILGGKLAEEMSSTSVEAGFGAAIYAYNTSILNISGGAIESGEVPEKSYRTSSTDGSTITTYTPKGDCVYLNSADCRVILSGRANVDEIYLKAANGENITIGKAATADSEAKSFAGTAVVNAENLSVSAAGVDIGTVAYGEIPDGLTCKSDSCRLRESSGDLIVYEGQGVACIGNAFYEDIASAITNYDGAEGSYIQLLAPVTGTMTVNKEVYLDLNGYNIENVAGTGTLYCMDSETDDYQVNAETHTGYGKIAGTVNATVKAVPVEAACAEDGYLMVTEDGYGTSFHRVNLQLTSINLRAEKDADGKLNPGVYYKSAFAADAVVANRIDTFGVELSTKAFTNTDGLETDKNYSWFGSDLFVAGKENTGTATSTLLKGIMKESNHYLVNNSNSQIPVYGRAYIEMGGEYLFGASDSRSLKEFMEGKDDDAAPCYGLDDLWDDQTPEKQSAILEMYKTYKSVMGVWTGIPNIKAALQEQENATLKILGIGNSYTMDSMWMLNEAWRAEEDAKIAAGLMDEEDRTKLFLGIAYVGGQTLSGHVENIKNRTEEYIYFYLDSETGVWTPKTAAAAAKLPDEEKVTLEEIIAAEDWDYVSLQQASTLSGVASTYDKDIASIQKYVNRTLGYTPTYLWNMTWAYPSTNTSDGFATYYQNSQKTMYDKIVAAVQTKIVLDETFSYLMPVGTAIQNAKATMLDTDLHRDASHLNDYGRFIAAYIWYCKLNNVQELETLQLKTISKELEYTGKTMITLNDNQLTVALNAINDALENNFTTTGEFTS